MGVETSNFNLSFDCLMFAVAVSVQTVYAYPKTKPSSAETEGSSASVAQADGRLELSIHQQMVLKCLVPCPLSLLGQWVPTTRSSRMCGTCSSTSLLGGALEGSLAVPRSVCVCVQC